MATDGGVSRFNLKRSSTAEPLFVTYVPDQEPDARRVNALAVDPTGIIWLATYNGLYRMEAGPGFRLARCIIGGSKKNRPSRTEEWLCEKH